MNSLPYYRNFAPLSSKMRIEKQNHQQQKIMTAIDKNKEAEKMKLNYWLLVKWCEKE